MGRYVWKRAAFFLFIMESFDQRLISPKFTKEFGPSASIVLAELVEQYVNNEGVFKMSLTQLCAATGLGVGAVKRSVANLEAFGFIKTKCGGVGNIKHFQVPYPDDSLEEYFNVFQSLKNDQ